MHIMHNTQCAAQKQMLVTKLFCPEVFSVFLDCLRILKKMPATPASS